MRSAGAVILSLLALLVAACGDAGRRAQTRPNILLIVVDTLRADHLHTYGYHLEISDNMDALAAQGWVFENHIASSAQTVPSTLSMLLSLHPPEHGFSHSHPGKFAERRPRYPEELLFLSEVFSAVGYDTAGFVGNPFLKEANGFAQGFDSFFYSKRRGSSLTFHATRWLRDHADRQRPFFIYLHYFDPHWPYDPPPSYRREFEAHAHGDRSAEAQRGRGVGNQDLATSLAMYDAEIAFVDDQIGRMIEVVEDLGLRDQTLIVVTSDHGEEFRDHGGVGHGTTVYGELIRVPLILVYPEKLQPGRRVEHLTHHIDLAPTLLVLAGIPRPPEFRGGTLTEATSEAYAEEGSWRAVYSEDRKLIVNDETGSVGLFALSDKLDQTALDDEVSRRRLAGFLDWYRKLGPSYTPSAPAPDAETEWSEEEMDQLRALGYAE